MTEQVNEGREIIQKRIEWNENALKQLEDRIRAFKSEEKRIRNEKRDAAKLLEMENEKAELRKKILIDMKKDQRVAGGGQTGTNNPVSVGAAICAWLFALAGLILISVAMPARGITAIGVTDAVARAYWDGGALRVSFFLICISVVLGIASMLRQIGRLNRKGDKFRVSTLMLTLAGFSALIIKWVLNGDLMF